MTRQNLVILTGGLNGSSVLAGLISQGAYWLGDETAQVAYETFENQELVERNRDILAASGYGWDDPGDLPPPSIEAIIAAADEVDPAPYRALLERCEANQPWLWKDPRLCFTMHFWQRLHDFRSCKFIIMERELDQSWTGLVMRGKVRMPYDKFLQIQANTSEASRAFLAEHGIPYHRLTFEDLIVTPERALAGLNDFLDLELTLDDLTRVYRGQLYRRRWSRLDFAKGRLKLAICQHVLRQVLEFPQARRQPATTSGN